MFDIPPGARHVLIQEDEASPHVLGKCFCLLVCDYHAREHGDVKEVIYASIYEYRHSHICVRMYVHLYVCICAYVYAYV